MNTGMKPIRHVTIVVLLLFIILLCYQAIVTSKQNPAPHTISGSPSPTVTQSSACLYDDNVYKVPSSPTTWLSDNPAYSPENLGYNALSFYYNVPYDIEAIEIVQNTKLFSGRTIREELDASFPSIPQDNRWWMTHHPCHDDGFVRVIYSLNSDDPTTDEADEISWRWLVPVDNRGKPLKNPSIGAENELAEFILKTDIEIQRAKIFSNFSRKEQDIYLWYKTALKALDPEDQKTVNIQKFVSPDDEERYSMSKQEIVETFRKIHNTLPEYQKEMNRKN